MTRRAPSVRPSRRVRVREMRMDVIGWRDVPTDAVAADLGESALATEPEVAQLFVKPSEAVTSGPDP